MNGKIQSCAYIKFPHLSIIVIAIILFVFVDVVVGEGTEDNRYQESRLGKCLKVGYCEK